MTITRSGAGDEPDATAPPARRYAPGSAVGRFVLLSRLGSGGMGTVFSAFDPQLDRKVAIKLLHPGRWGTESLTEGQQRLLVEARAMARLDHPNVVTVFDAGTSEGRVYLAMEHVAGTTLRGWLSAAPRSWREIVGMFVQAGRGLAAAHRAGLVHRDVKPDNVLVDDDGRARITDFGLAGATGAWRRGDDDAADDLDDADDDGEGDGGQAVTRPRRGARADAPDDVDAPDDDVADGTDDEDDEGDIATAPTRSPIGSMTRTGALVGTPRYMAPEQHAGATVDARADQFGYCVALYEALWDRWPFGDEPGDDAAAAVGAGAAAPPDGRVPARIRRAVMRGLALDPAARFSSMDALLAELERSTAARGRIALGAAVSAVVAGLAVAATVRAGGDGGARVCRGGDDVLAATWRPEVAAALASHFHDTGARLADDQATRTIAALDAYADAWVDAWVDACRATRVQGAQSEAVLDLRMACLDRRRGELDQLVGALAAVDADGVLGAVGAVERLPAVRRCADLDYVTRAVPPPDDAGVEAEVAAIRHDLDRVAALLELGQIADALTAATAAARRADDVAYPPVRAEALLLLGDAQQRTDQAEAAEATLARAFATALGSRHAEVAADAAIAYVEVVGNDRSDLARATRWYEVVAAPAVEALGADRDARGRLGVAIAVVEQRQGAYAEAEAHVRAAIDDLEAADGPDHAEVGGAYKILGAVLAGAEDDAGAVAAFRHAVEIFERTRGPQHPAVAGALVNVAIVQERRGEVDDAEARAARALAIFEAAYGPDYTANASVHGVLASLALRRAAYDDAAAHYQRAAELWAAAHGADDPRVGQMENGLGLVALDRHDYVGARAHLERALAIKERALGPDHPSVAGTLLNLGLAWDGDGHWREAAQAYAQALACAEAALGPDHAQVADVLLGLARVHAHASDLARARAEAQRAAAIYEHAHGSGHPDLAVALAVVGEIRVRQGARVEGRVALERAFAICEATTCEADDVGPLYLHLADALDRDQRGRARGLAQRAADVAAAHGDADLQAAAARWLREHPP
ncbi:MAG: serine/threonine protein kinase [Kofleriaceae bacterium]|nr:serine/threonine protein kinase [Kofleriaceae bacterium]